MNINNRIKSVRQTGLKGFTLIELVLVIAILGILAVVALPTLFNTTLTTARTNAAAMTASAVREGIGIYMSDQVARGLPKAYPATLDGATNGSAAASTNVLFQTVLEQGVTSGWNKVSSSCYTYDANGSGVTDTGDVYYEYTPATGGFEIVTTCT